MGCIFYKGNNNLNINDKIREVVMFKKNISPLFLLYIMEILFLLLFTACKKEKSTLPAGSIEKKSVKSENSNKKYEENLNKKNAVHEENSDLKRFFIQNDISGSITLYDYKNKKWIYSDKGDTEIRTLPASTFKIPNSLIFLEEGLVKDENVAIKWDGTNWKHEEWNKDTSLKEAFKNSTVWFHKEQARKIGKEKYRKYLKEFNYGDQIITIDSSDKPDEFNNFWLNGTLKISPIEQINFLLGYMRKNTLFQRKTMLL